MAVSFPRLIPDVGYVASDLILRDTVTASPSGGGLINYTQVAAPAWEVTLETRPLDYDEYSAVEAWWLSLRGGLRSVLFRQPHNGYPMAHRTDNAPARTPGRLASVSSGNALSIISVDPALILSAGDRIGLEHANRWYVGRVTEASGSGTTRVISVEPPPPSNVAQPGAVVRFDRPGLLMRPVPDSYQATRSGRHYSVSFRLAEVAGVGSVPRDMDFNFTSPLVAAPYFTRASSATYYGADGLLKTAAINEPRIDHDPVSGAWRGLLMEGRRTNLLLRSSEFDHSYWAKTNVVVLPNVALASDGTMSADKLVATAVNGFHYVENANQMVVAGPLTASFTLEQGGYTQASAYLIDSTGIISASTTKFDLANGTVTVGSGKITPLGGGRFRASITGAAVAGNSRVRIIIENGGTGSFVGDDVSGIYVSDAQIEQGANATSYIPTTGAQATRIEDSVVVPTDGWLREDEATVFACFKSLTTWPQTVWRVDKANSQFNSHYFRKSGTVDQNTAQFVSFENSVVKNNIPVSFGAGVRYKTALAWKSGDSAAGYNGQVLTSSGVGMPVGLSHLRVGSVQPEPLFGWIERVTCFSRRLSNAELQEITT